MSRLLPHPLLSVALFALWLLLNGTGAGHLVLGAAVALGAGAATARIEPARLRIRQPHLLIRLFLVVFADIVRSNLAVARAIVTGPRRHPRRAAFVPVHLTLTSEAALALLAAIVTATPGTAWVEYDPRSGVMLLHVFDLHDGEDWQRIIDTRYQSILTRIFE